jgi:hypothetical protein
MKSLPNAIADARASRAELLKTLHDVREKLTISGLAEDMLGALDPELTFLNRVKAGLKRRPLIAAGLVASAGWLVNSLMRTRRQSGSNRPLKSRRRKIKPGNTYNPKGD